MRQRGEVADELSVALANRQTVAPSSNYNRAADVGWPGDRRTLSIKKDWDAGFGDR
jgi:hypothetical protein